MKRLFALFMLLVISIACTAEEKKEVKTEKFEIDRGLNVSHWLSQSTEFGEKRAEYVTKKDINLIAGFGFDHIRLPIDEEHMWDEEGNRNQNAFDLMHKAIGWSLENNLRVIVDLHVLRSHHFNRPDSRKLWEDKSSQEGFIKFWKELSGELKKYPNHMVAYEPLNEAVSNNPEDWNNLINWVISEIRKLEPERTIVMGSNNWQTVGSFKDLRVPEGDKNIILSFHYYTPFLLTHYKTYWSNLKDYDGPVNYPGMSVDTLTYPKLNEADLGAVKSHNNYYDQKVIDKDIYQAVEVAKKYGLKLYCGEYGAFPSTGLDMRVEWYKDMMAIFNKYDIAWSHWNYKNDFPVVNEDLSPINEIIGVMIPKK